MGVCLTILVAAPALASGADKNADSAPQLMQKGTVEFQHGHYAEAADQWWRAAGLYESANKPELQVKALIRFSEALHYTGRYRDTIFALTQAINLSRQLGDQSLIAIIHGRLGNAHFALDETREAQQQFTEGLILADRIHNVALKGSLSNDLGNVLVSQAVQDYRESEVWRSKKLEKDAIEARERGQEKNDQAIAHYTNGVINSRGVGNKPLEVTALMNLAKAFILRGQPENAREQVDEASKQARKLPASSQKAYALIDIGMAYQDLQTHLSDSRPALLALAETSMKEAATIGVDITDARAKSYAWGQLGNLYEEQGRFEEALDQTGKAVFAAQLIDVPESLYRWEWQLGRVYRDLGQVQQAEAAYKRAIQSLKRIPRDLPGGYRSSQVTFRNGPGRLFFELSNLYLEGAASAKNQKEQHAKLIQARSITEEFKTAEIQDYYQDDCVEAYGESIKTMDEVIQDGTDTMVIYPIIFPDRLELLVTLPGQLHHYVNKITEKQLKETVDEFRWGLEEEESFQFLGPAKQLYNWLIKPVAADLDLQKIHTLVIVPDGPLRTIPLAALYDEENKVFLIQKFAIATASGFNLPDPKPMDRDNIKILSVGLTTGGENFAPLPGVKIEQNEMQRVYGANNITTLFDEDFQVANVEKAMKKDPFTIVHVATHGKFENDVTNSFLLASNNKKLTMNDLDQMMGLFKFRDTPLDLLTLSACETAAGDDRAALGLAGIALKAGARSALATLWAINDEASSKLVSWFYEELHNTQTLTKAQALQQAQIRMLKNPKPHYQHPFYWSAFLLLNNWL